MKRGGPFLFSTLAVKVGVSNYFFFAQSSTILILPSRVNLLLFVCWLIKYLLLLSREEFSVT